MKLPTIISILVAAASALPTPQEQQTTSAGGVQAFNLMSLRSASPIHFGRFSATRGGIYINLPAGEQDATCEGEDSNTATFYIKDGGLFLYHGHTTKPQQVFVDRSGMGQGKIGYISGDQPPPRHAELQGWATERRGEFDFLNFNGSSLLGCPAVTGDTWSVWLAAGVDTPGGHEGCLGMSAMVQPNEAPVSCLYSE